MRHGSSKGRGTSNCLRLNQADGIATYRRLAVAWPLAAQLPSARRQKPVGRGCHPFISFTGYLEDTRAEICRILERQDLFLVSSNLSFLDVT